MKSILVVLLVLFSCLILAQTKAPQFKGYPVNEIFDNQLAKLLPSTIDELKNTVIENGDTVFNYVQRIANFAGHYEIIE